MKSLIFGSIFFLATVSQAAFVAVSEDHYELKNGDYMFRIAKKRVANPGGPLEPTPDPRNVYQFESRHGSLLKFKCFEVPARIDLILRYNDGQASLQQFIFSGVEPKVDCVEEKSKVNQLFAKHKPSDIEPLEVAINADGVVQGRKLTRTRMKDAPMKDCKIDDVVSCFGTREDANHGFQFLHRDGAGNVVKTKYVALLLHGLSDSPYFFRDIAIDLHKMGLNVVAPRWTGHGTRAPHLAKTKYTEWLEDAKFAKEMVKPYGEKTILGGMSMGGAHNAYQAAFHSDDIHGLMMFAPAIKMPTVFQMTARIGGLFGLAQGDKDYGIETRYQNFPSAPARQLVFLQNKAMDGLKYLRRDSRAGAPRSVIDGHKVVDMPVFMVLTEYDNAIDNLRAAKFVYSSTKPHFVYLDNPAEKADLEELAPYKEGDNTVVIRTTEAINHASTTLKDREDMLTFTPEINPLYEDVAAELKKFIQGLE